MTNDDFDAGRSGAAPGPTSDPIAFTHGQNVRAATEQVAADEADARKRASSTWRPTQKVEVSGLGIMGLMIAPALPFIYPVGGSIVLSGFLLAAVLFELVGGEIGGWQYVVGLVALLALTPFAGRVETRVSQYRVYRFLRHIFRAVVVGSFLVNMVLTNGQVTNMTELGWAYDRASPRVVFYTWASYPIVFFLGVFLDRFVFPRMRGPLAPAEGPATEFGAGLVITIPMMMKYGAIFGFATLVFKLIVPQLYLVECAIILLILWVSVAKYRRKKRA